MILDKNNDNKLDIKDFLIFLEQSIDTNNDGKISIEELLFTLAKVSKTVQELRLL